MCVEEGEEAGVSGAGYAVAVIVGAAAVAAQPEAEIGLTAGVVASHGDVDVVGHHEAEGSVEIEESAVRSDA